MPKNVRSAPAGIALLLAASVNAAAADVVVFKTKTCGCCAKSVEHLRTSKFKVTVNEVTSTAEYRKQYGVPAKLQSCHTAVVDGYTIEGHVPAADMQRMLKEKPKAKGIAVPGMPAGSPGMESDRREAYTVFQFDDKGALSSFQQHPGDNR